MMRSIGLCILLLLLSVVGQTQARVIDVVVEKKTLISPDGAMASHDAYERLEGIITFSFDPENPQNAQIVDLKHAVQNDHGQVEAPAAEAPAVAAAAAAAGLFRKHG